MVVPGFSEKVSQSTSEVLAISHLFSLHFAENMMSPLDFDCSPFASVSAVAWNSAGSLLSVAYARTDHAAFCEHRAAVCIWNLMRRQFDSQSPDYVIETEVSVLFHVVFLSLCEFLCVNFHFSRVLSVLIFIQFSQTF